MALPTFNAAGTMWGSTASATCSSASGGTCVLQPLGHQLVKVGTTSETESYVALSRLVVAQAKQTAGRQWLATGQASGMGAMAAGFRHASGRPPTTATPAKASSPSGRGCSASRPPESKRFITQATHGAARSGTSPARFGSVATAARSGRRLFPGKQRLFKFNPDVGAPEDCTPPRHEQRQRCCPLRNSHVGVRRICRSPIPRPVQSN